MAEIRHLENRHGVIFSAKGGPIWITFRRLVQKVDCDDVVEIETRCSNMANVWTNPMECHPKPRVALHGAATW